MQYMNVLLQEVSLQFNVEYYTTTENESVILYAIAISWRNKELAQAFG